MKCSDNEKVTEVVSVDPQQYFIVVSAPRIESFYSLVYKHLDYYISVNREVIGWWLLVQRGDDFFLFLW